MSITLYFSKINLNSHIYKVYDDSKLLDKILNSLRTNIVEDVVYQKTYLYQENGENFISNADYKFNSLNKFGPDFNNSIVGSILKTSNLFINKIDKISKELIRTPIENSEVIQFYFDVYKEIIVFYTTNRFGYQEFNNAFEELINLCMSKTDEKYKFEVSLIREGLNIDQIQEELSELGPLSSLQIQIIPPNPDDNLLEELRRNGSEYLDKIKSGNVTSRSILFTSDAPDGLNLNSEILKEEITAIDRIHSQVSAEEATKKGYANVEAVAKSGRIYTSKQNKPIKDTLDEKKLNMYDFALACKSKISVLLRSL